MKGVLIYNINDNQLFETRETLYAGAKAGWLNPYIWKEFSLKKAADAHTLLKSGAGAYGKIILTTN